MSSLGDALANPALTVEQAALLVAHELEPTVDVATTLGRLDELAEPLRAPARKLGMREGESSAEARAELLAGYLGRGLGFAGNETDYYAPENSLLDRVLVRRVGIPITLAVVYVAVGTRVGMPVEGIGFPGHFLVRVGGPGGVYQDPFHRGALLDSDRLAELARRFIGPGAVLAPSHLGSVDARSVALRMLTNLEAAYARRNEHARAWVAADRLLAITKDDGHRRNRGLHALAMGSNAIAADDLELYVGAHPTAPDRDRLKALVERARAGARKGTLN
jgi:regulator of sirC expression with transglutaminase-like and TPR domain